MKVFKATISFILGLCGWWVMTMLLTAVLPNWFDSKWLLRGAIGQLIVAGIILCIYFFLLIVK